MAQRYGPGQPNSPVERSQTVLETDEDIRQALLSGLKSPPPTVAPEQPAEPTPAVVRPAGASVFRPTVRPPVPILTVFDDGKTDGELIRIRDSKFTIGRTEGDLRFPLDGRMSARHVEITHQVVGGLHRWVVTDLQSTHGMFVRVSKTHLTDRAEILVGGGRYRFEQSQADPGVADDSDSSPNTGSTRGWSEGVGPFRPPALTELIGREIGNRILLVKGEYWIGSEPGCAVCRQDDPFCDPRHVRIYRGAKGGWNAEHNKTQNGLWLRMVQIACDAMILFQIGEQRFKLKIQ
jgi:hypothetical protein